MEVHPSMHLNIVCTLNKMTYDTNGDVCLPLIFNIETCNIYIYGCNPLFPTNKIMNREETLAYKKKLF